MREDTTRQAGKTLAFGRLSPLYANSPLSIIGTFP